MLNVATLARAWESRSVTHVLANVATQLFLLTNLTLFIRPDLGEFDQDAGTVFHLFDAGPFQR